MTHGFPNQFFIGYIQGGLNATITEQFGKQGHHIAYIISEALKRGIDGRRAEPGSAGRLRQALRGNRDRYLGSSSANARRATSPTRVR